MLYKLTDKVWVKSTAGVVEGPESLIVIDPGYNKEIVSDINDLCITLRKPVKHLVYTHLHLDHTLNERYFKGTQHVAPPSFDNVKKDNVSIDLNGACLNVYKTPGHCESGDISVLVDDVLFTGDMINKNHVPLVFDYGAFISSLGKIGSIDFKKAYSAHSGIFSREMSLDAVKKMIFYIKRARQLVAAVGPRIKGKDYLEIYLSLLSEAGFSREEIDEKLSTKDRNKLTHYDYFRGLLSALSKSIPLQPQP